MLSRIILMITHLVCIFTMMSWWQSWSVPELSYISRIIVFSITILFLIMIMLCCQILLFLLLIGSFNSPLPMLTHWNILLIRIPGAITWRYVLPIQPTQFILCISQSNIVIMLHNFHLIIRHRLLFIAQVSWWIFVLSTVPIHDQSIFILPSSLQDILSSSHQHIFLSYIICM